MTQNWNFEYLSEEGGFNYLPIFLPDFMRKVKEPITYDPAHPGVIIDYPYFLIRIYNIETGSVVELYPSLGPYNVNEFYGVMYITAFDNLGTPQTTQNLFNGVINVHKEFNGNSLKIEVVEMKYKYLEPPVMDIAEQGILWSGMANYKNLNHPQVENKEYLESGSNRHDNYENDLYTTYKTNN